VAVARAADPDPWRDALRANGTAAPSPAALAALQRLAGDTAALDTQPAASLVLLAHQLKQVYGDHNAATRVLRRAVFRHPGDYWVHFDLANAASNAESAVGRIQYPQPEEAVRHLTAALAIRPRSPYAHANLGTALDAQAKYDEAVAEYREAIRLKPGSADFHISLGYALNQQGKCGDAIAAYREAIRLKPDSLSALSYLGQTLASQGKHDEAIEAFRAMIRLKPDGSMASHGHVLLGQTLRSQGKRDEAVDAYSEATRLKPDSHVAHLGLGQALGSQGNHDEAIKEFRAAIRLKPNDSLAHLLLAQSLAFHGKRDEAIDAYQELIRLNPGGSMARVGLGQALSSQGKRDDAIKEFRAAIRLNPNDSSAHLLLAQALDSQRKRNEAIDAYREAIRLKPSTYSAHFNLGRLLEDDGKLEEALSVLQKAAALAQPSSPFARTLPESIRRLERQVALLKRLPDILKGADHAANPAETVAFAQLCSRTRRPAAAARLWSRALLDDPGLGDDRKAQHRYNAACAAALAAAGKGADEPAPDGGTRAALRAQALGWLKGEYDAWVKLLDTGKPQDRATVAKTLAHWAQDADLASVRDAGALDDLPEAERAAWRALWSDVDALRQRADHKSR
jgi:superkiller protein 3